MEVFATERDFRLRRKFCGFRVVINEKELTVEECGEVEITQAERNQDLRILWLGHISNPIKQLRLQSASHGSFTGYYVDYADNREEALKGACEAARIRHKQMMDQLDLQLAKMQGTELTVIKRCKC